MFFEHLAIPVSIIIGGALFFELLRKRPFLGAMPELLEKARRPQPISVKLEKSVWPQVVLIISLLLVFFASITLVELLQAAYYALFFPGNELVFVNNVGALVILMLSLIICDLSLFEWFFQNGLIRRFVPGYYLYCAAEFMYRNKYGWVAVLGRKPENYHAKLETILAEYDPNKFFVPMQQTYLRRRLIMVVVLVPIMLLSLMNYITFSDKQVVVKDFWNFKAKQYPFTEVEKAKVDIEFNFKNDKSYPEPHFIITFKDQREVDLWQGVFFLNPSADKLITAFNTLKTNGVSLEVGFLTPLTNLREGKRREIEKVFEAINPNTVPVINYKKISEQTSQKIKSNP